MEDAGGIVCDIAAPPEAEQARIVSLTYYLRVDRDHPLAQEIRAYQRKRMKRIVRSGGSREATSVLIRLQKERKRRRRWRDKR